MGCIGAGAGRGAIALRRGGGDQSPALDPARPVRIPGEAALERARQARRDGVPLAPAIVTSMRGLAERYGVKAGELGE